MIDFSPEYRPGKTPPSQRAPDELPTFSKSELHELGREPFIRGYGQIKNPDAEIFDLHSPLPGDKHVFGPGALMGDEEAWALVPKAGAKLYQLCLSEQPRSTYFVVKKGEDFRFFIRYDGSHPSGCNVVESVTREQLPKEAGERLTKILRSKEE